MPYICQLLFVSYCLSVAMAMKPFQNTIALEDAARLSGPLAFNIMLKPAGSLCNLDCQYCYYLDKSEIYAGRKPRMSLEDLEKVVRAYIEANDVPEVTFNWHGGEPLVMGLEFYEKAVGFEAKYAGGKRIFNTIQTNGTLVTDEWADFFAGNRFLVGISIDGPEDIHDRYRRDKGGFPTFDRVMAGLARLKKAGVEFNTMSTVNKFSEGRGLEVYQFLKSIGSRYMQFMPVVEHVKYPVGENGKLLKRQRPFIVNPSAPGAQLAPWSVRDVAFGDFLCDIFDYWVRNDVGRCFVNIFDAALASWCGVNPGSCVYAATCGGNSVVEHNGDLYPCDHFVYPEYLVGNVFKEDLRDLMRSDRQTSFGLDKRASLPGKCSKCEFLFACNGECPKHRFNVTERRETGLNALCLGYYKFYRHIAPAMKIMRSLLQEGHAPAEIMALARMGGAR